MKQWCSAVFIILNVGCPALAEGALAVGRDGRGGHWFSVSWNKRTLVEAEAHALSMCRQRGPCRIARSFSERCLGVVFSRFPDGRAGYGMMTAPSMALAQQGAMAGCYRSGASCEFKKAFCDSGRGEIPRAPTPPASGSDAPVGGGEACRRWPNLC
jgi:hypothetical protein